MKLDKIDCVVDFIFICYYFSRLFRVLYFSIESITRIRSKTNGKKNENFFIVLWILVVLLLPLPFYVIRLWKFMFFLHNKPRILCDLHMMFIHFLFVIIWPHQFNFSSFYNFEILKLLLFSIFRLTPCHIANILNQFPFLLDVKNCFLSFVLFFLSPFPMEILPSDKTKQNLYLHLSV